MRVDIAFSVMVLMVLSSQVAIAAPCTPAQRTELTKLGYDQNEVKRLCGNALALFDKAYKAKENGELQSAQVLAEQGLRIEPANTLGKKLLAEIKEAKESLGGGAQKLFEAAFNAKEQGDLQTAEQLFEQGLRIEPGNAMAQSLLAEVREARAKAQQLFAQGYNAKQAGDLQTAQQSFEEGLRYDPKNALAQQYLAEVKDQASMPRVGESAAAAIQRQLEARYRLARLNSNGSDIVTNGTVAIVQRDNLIMNKVYLSGREGVSMPMANVYQNGSITQMELLKAVRKLDMLLSNTFGIPDSSTRSFANGERVAVTAINIQPDGIVLRLMSDSINNTRYHGTISFPFPTGDVRAASQAVMVVGDVLGTE